MEQEGGKMRQNAVLLLQCTEKQKDDTSVKGCKRVLHSSHVSCIFLFMQKGFTDSCEAFLPWMDSLFSVTFPVSQNADACRQKSRQSIFDPAAAGTGNHRSQRLIMKKHGA